jgi:hypothetical protein
MRLPSYVLKFRFILYFNTWQVYNCVKGQNDVETDGSTFEKISKPPNLSGGGMEDSKMKRVLSLILAAGLALSLSACGDVLVDLDTPKSSELSAQYDFYPDSMNTIRADMQITPEQADDVFIALVSCGLDGKISTVSETDGVYKVRWGTNTLEVMMNDDGTISEISDGKDVLYPEYKQYNFLLDCDVKTSDVKSGSGDVIGQRAFVSVLKSQLAELTAENFAEFAETVVKDSGYNYFTIKCDDGTGIVFGGSDVTIPVYGTLDDDGRVTDTAGFITRGVDGSYTYEQAD